MDPRLLTVREVAHWYRVHPRTVYRWVNAGTIRAVRLGRNLRIPATEIERVESAETPTPSVPKGGG